MAGLFPVTARELPLRDRGDAFEGKLDLLTICPSVAAKDLGETMLGEFLGADELGRWGMAGALVGWEEGSI